MAHKQQDEQPYLPFMWTQNQKPTTATTSSLIILIYRNVLRDIDSPPNRVFWGAFPITLLREIGNELFGHT